MNYLEQAKQKLTEYEEKKRAFFRELKEVYDDDNIYEDESAVEKGLCDGDFILDWDDKRDAVYVYNAVQCQTLLIEALELLEQRDTKSLHNANKALETLVHVARGIRKERASDIQKAQNVIDAMNDIIKVCDELRK